MIRAEGTKDSSKMLPHFLRAVKNSSKHIQCPAGLAGQGETPQALQRRGGSPTASGKRSAWNSNQQVNKP
ncbi:hypothetical protein [Neobacillus sp. FSL H8-0543]|uniref:hypothetical protein n=1 Tax=Neobacillus sp. FSL H8-0543 TaxID=2954672 RepID=UPI0031597C8B